MGIYGNTFGLPHLIIILAVSALWIFSFITLWRARTRVSPGALIIWTAVIIVFSILGSIAWIITWATTKRLRSA
jgi:hypothetical protein